MKSGTEAHSLRRESLVEQLAAELLTLIVDQGLDEGDSLPSTTMLASRFNVSVVVVREAIAILVGRGIVRRQQGREPVVLRPGSEVLDSLFRVRASQDGISAAEIEQCRSALELQAAALAAAAADEGHRRAVLEPLLADMRNADALDGLSRADQKFHEGIVELSGNRALALLIGALRTAVQHDIDENWHRWFDARQDGSPDRAIVLHEEIGAAIIRGDRDASITAMAAHFLEWSERIDFGQLNTIRLGRGSGAGVPVLPGTRDAM